MLYPMCIESIAFTCLKWISLSVPINSLIPVLTRKIGLVKELRCLNKCPWTSINHWAFTIQQSSPYLGALASCTLLVDSLLGNWSRKEDHERGIKKMISLASLWSFVSVTRCSNTSAQRVFTCSEERRRLEKRWRGSVSAWSWRRKH